MKKGIIEINNEQYIMSGKGEVYNENGNIILENGEKILFTIHKGDLYTTTTSGGSLAGLIDFFQTKVDILYTHGGYNKEEILPPSMKISFTNYRILGIRKPKPLLGDLIKFIGGKIHVYFKEKAFEKCNELIWELIEFSEDIILKILIEKEVIGFHLKSQGKDAFAALCIRRPIQIPIMQSLIRFVENMKIPIEYTERGKIRWLKFMKVFRYEDVDGLNKFYDKKGEPILEIDEKIIEKKELILITIFLRKTAPLTILPFEFILPKKGTLYKTNKRIIFIREITEDDLHYREFPEGTKIYFSFNLNDAKIGKKFDGELYDINIDKYNRIQIIIPKDVEKARKWYNKNVRGFGRNVEVKM